MSAYVVSNETINCIVNGMIDNRIIGRLSAQEVDQQLFDQNQKSVNFLYSEEEQAPKFEFERKAEMFGGILMNAAEMYTDTQIYGCIRCWMYQSCEDPQHRDSEAWRYVKCLEEALVEKKFPDAPWGL